MTRYRRDPKISEASGAATPKASMSDHSQKAGTDAMNTSVSTQNCNFDTNLPAADSLTMSSREIAELTNKRHADVMRDIRTMLSQLYSDNADLRYQSIQGVTVVSCEQTKRDREILLDREHAECLVTGYSAALRMRVIRRLRELEQAWSRPALPDFSDPVAAARAWADAKESEQRALAQIQAARPALEFVDRYVSAQSGNKGFRQVAKLLPDRLSAIYRSGQKNAKKWQVSCHTVGGCCAK